MVVPHYHILTLLLHFQSAASMSSAVTRIAVGQLRSTNNKHKNLIDVAKCAGWAKSSGASMIFLPECLGFMGDNATHTLQQADPEIDLNGQNENIPMDPFHQTLLDAINSPDDTTISFDTKIKDNPSIVQGLQFIARESGLWVSGGGVHTRVPNQSDKIFNTHVIIDDKGHLKAHYHKIHLFDVSIPNKVNLQESKTTSPGTKLVLCDSPIGKLGLSICYDMRFSEMYVDMVKKGAQVLLAPSAFTVPTGKAHWHALLRARSIESQCYVIAAAQVGRHNERRESFGHSLVYDPWGELLVDAGGYDGAGTGGNIAESDEYQSPVVCPSIVACDIDLGKIDSTRLSMPINQHRMNSKYSLARH